MLNKDCASSVHSTNEASKKTLRERLFSSAAHLFSNAKAKYKERHLSSASRVRTLSSLASPNGTRNPTQSQPSPPGSPYKANDVQDGTISTYEADPIFTALDANDLPDLSLSISGEADPSYVPDVNYLTPQPGPTRPGGSAKVPKASIFLQKSQTKEDHSNSHAFTPVTPPKDKPIEISSNDASRFTSPPPTPSYSISSPLRLPPQRATSLTHSRATDREQMFEGEAQKESGTKRRGSLSLSLFSKSPSACSRTSPKSPVPNLPVTSLSTPILPVQPQLSPMSDLFPKHSSEFPSPDTSATHSSITSSPLLPGFATLGPRRGSNLEHDNTNIPVSKANVVSKLDRNEDKVNPVAEYANALASPPPTSGHFPGHFPSNSYIEKRRTSESKILNLDSNHKSSSGSGLKSVSQFTITACGQSPAAANTRRPSVSFFPNSQATPPPTPPFSVPEPSPSSTKLQRPAIAEISNTSVDSNVCGSNDDASTNTAKISPSTDPCSRLRSMFDSNETIKLTLTPDLVRGLDGEFGKVCIGHENEEDYKSDEQGSESGDDDFKIRELCRIVEIKKSAILHGKMRKVNENVNGSISN